MADYKVLGMKSMLPLGSLTWLWLLYPARAVPTANPLRTQWPTQRLVLKKDATPSIAASDKLLPNWWEEATVLVQVALWRLIWPECFLVRGECDSPK